MMKDDRASAIRQHLYSAGHSSIQEIASAVGASPATIRRDLVALEMEGAITLLEAHAIAEAVMADVQAAFPHAEVLIHEDPAGIDEPRAVFT